jgi:hypothetical protein
VSIQSTGKQPAIVISAEVEKITQKKKIHFGCRHHGNRPDSRRILRLDRIYDGIIGGQFVNPMIVFRTLLKNLFYGIDS